MRSLAMHASTTRCNKFPTATERYQLGLRITKRLVFGKHILSFENNTMTSLSFTTNKPTKMKTIRLENQTMYHLKKLLKFNFYFVIIGKKLLARDI